MKQRIVFMNLHANEMWVKNLSKILFKQSVAIKHKYLLEWLLDNPRYELATFVTPDGFSLGDNYGRLGQWLNIFRFWEHRYVMRKNGIPAKRIKVLKRASQLRDDDIVLVPRFGLSRAIDRPMRGLVAFAMMHFGSGDGEISDIMQRMGVDVIYNESDLTRFSTYFPRFFPWYKKQMVVIPFVYQERFRPLRPFDERENRAFATGTVTYKESPDFVGVYGDPCVQPMRKALKEHGNDTPELIYSTCSDYSEGARKAPTRRFGLLGRLWYSWYYRTHASQQKKYYSFDMVEMFNRFKMCVVGEEILGVPGIGAFEGMACGCAMLGLNNGIYEQYGLQEGVHYIGYDGTLDDLRAKIRHWQLPEQAERLRSIADAGCRYVREHFNGPTVAASLIASLEQLRDAKLRATTPAKP